jgi:hypothetical protein
MHLVSEILVSLSHIIGAVWSLRNDPSTGRACTRDDNEERRQRATALAVAAEASACHTRQA